MYITIGFLCLYRCRILDLTDGCHFLHNRKSSSCSENTHFVIMHCLHPYIIALFVANSFSYNTRIDFMHSNSICN